MSGSAYPSPISSPSLSPNLESSALRSTIQSPVPAPMTPDDRASLRHHLDRIRILRRSLLEQGNEAASMTPGHQALVLTGYTNDLPRLSDQPVWTRLSEVLPPATMERIIEFETRRTQQPLRIANATHTHPLDTTSHVSPSSSHPTSSAQSPSLLHSPLSPPRQRLLPPRTLQDLQPLRTRELSDDPNTLIGRRVAAREASRSSNGSNPRLDAYNLTEQEVDYIRTLARQRRSEPAFQRRPESSLDVIRREAEAHHARSSLDNPYISAGAPIRGQMRRALRTSRLDSRQTSFTSSAVPSPRNRLSTLSSFSSVQNLPTPSSTTSSQRVLLFDEPASYLPNAPTLEEGRTSTTTGELQVIHSINPMDDTFFVSSPVQVLPDNVLAPGLARRDNVRDHRRDNTALASDYVVPASTLFGTLIERDGNEALPGRYQILDPSLSQPSHPPSVGRWVFEDPAPSHVRSTIDHFEPITVTSFVPDEYPYSNSNQSPRVRINPHPRDPQDEESNQEDQQAEHPMQLIQSNKPLFVDPLPVPVEKMISNPEAQRNKKHRLPVKVSSHASFAGR